MNSSSDEYVTVEIDDTPNGFNFPKGFASYCRKNGVDATVFNYLHHCYTHYEKRFSEDGVIVALRQKFEDWFLTLSAAEQIKHLHTYQHPPYPNGTSSDHQYQIIANIVDSVFTVQLEGLQTNPKTPLSLKLSLTELLHHTHRLSLTPTLAHAPEQASLAFVVSAKTLCYLAIINPSQDNLNRLYALAKEASGHDRPIVNAVGGVLMAIGVAIALSALALSMPAYATYAPFAAEFLLNYYVASFITSYLCITGGIALRYIARASDLSLWTQRVAKHIEALPKDDVNHSDKHNASQDPVFHVDAHF